MENVWYYCPHCRHRNALRATYRGRRAACAQCHALPDAHAVEDGDVGKRLHTCDGRLYIGTEAFPIEEYPTLRGTVAHVDGAKFSMETDTGVTLEALTNPRMRVVHALEDLPDHRQEDEDVCTTKAHYRSSMLGELTCQSKRARRMTETACPKKFSEAMARTSGDLYQSTVSRGVDEDLYQSTVMDGEDQYQSTVSWCMAMVAEESDSVASMDREEFRGGVGFTQGSEDKWPEEMQMEWACPKCTHVNRRFDKKCICGSKRPASVGVGQRRGSKKVQAPPRQANGASDLRAKEKEEEEEAQQEEKQQQVWNCSRCKHPNALKVKFCKKCKKLRPDFALLQKDVGFFQPFTKGDSHAIEVATQADGGGEQQQEAAERYSDSEEGSAAAGQHSDSEEEEGSAAEEEEEEEGSAAVGRYSDSAQGRKATEADIKAATHMANKMLGAVKREKQRAARKAEEEQKKAAKQVENDKACEQRALDKQKKREEKKKERVDKLVVARKDKADLFEEIDDALDTFYGDSWWKPSHPMPSKLMFELTELPSKLRDVLSEHMNALLNHEDVHEFTQEQRYHYVNSSSGTNRDSKHLGWTSYVRIPGKTYYPSNTDRADVGALAVAAATCDWRLTDRRSAHDWLQYMREQNQKGEGDAAVERWITEVDPKTKQLFVDLGRIPKPPKKKIGIKASAHGPRAKLNVLARQGKGHTPKPETKPHMRPLHAPQSRKRKSPKEQHGADPSPYKDAGVERGGTVPTLPHVPPKPRHVRQKKRDGAGPSSANAPVDEPPSHPIECSFADPSAEVNAVASMAAAPNDAELEQAFANFSNRSDGS